MLPLGAAPRGLAARAVKSWSERSPRPRKTLPRSYSNDEMPQPTRGIRLREYIAWSVVGLPLSRCATAPPRGERFLTYHPREAARPWGNH